MRVDDIAAFIAAASAPYITAHSTVDVPLITPTAAMIQAHDYNEISGPLMIALEEGPRTSEWLTTHTRDVRQTITLYVFVQGATATKLRAQLSAYVAALSECLANYDDFNGVTGGDDYDGVEAKADIKAAKIEFELRWEE